ncbi:3-keto-disaccharide hydrolase [Terrimonas alba]|uniref:3-keto-disaccharide hydrolase n=1 Tax=Terrimonas alba TaxID=3349636 RepID=UPI0035F41B47
MKRQLCLLIAISSAVTFANAQNKVNRDTIDPKLTEVWSPVPPIVTPGKTSSDAPSDAVILFDGKNLDQWRSNKNPDQPAGWIVSDGVFTVKKGTGDIETKQSFTDYQLHLEWRIPKIIHGENQARGNSGVFLSTGGEGNGYEIQILDCYNNKTYVNGQTASVYKQSIPLANACKKPGEWQTYDIIWTAPRFNDDGSLKTPARVTVLHNGVLMQNNTELKGETVYRGQPSYEKHGAKPIKLQDHGDPSEPISFRNIWVRPL